MSAGLMAVRLWHLRVHDDDGEVVVVEQGFEGFPVGGDPDQLLLERRQNCGHRQQVVRLIIDDEDLVHALRPRRQHNRCGLLDGVQLAFEEIAAALRRSTLSLCLLKGCSEALDFQLESASSRRTSAAPNGERAGAPPSGARGPLSSFTERIDRLVGLRNAHSAGAALQLDGASRLYSATMAIAGHIPLPVLWHIVTGSPTASEIWLLLETLREQRRAAGE